MKKKKKKKSSNDKNEDLTPHFQNRQTTHQGKDFWKMVFWLVFNKLEISYNRVIIIISWRILVSFRGCFWRLFICYVVSRHVFSCFYLPCISCWWVLILAFFLKKI
jgi:hypothetical protein